MRRKNHVYLSSQLSGKLHQNSKQYLKNPQKCKLINNYKKILHWFLFNNIK